LAGADLPHDLGLHENIQQDTFGITNDHEVRPEAKALGGFEQMDIIRDDHEPLTCRLHQSLINIIGLTAVVLAPKVRLVALSWTEKRTVPPGIIGWAGIFHLARMLGTSQPEGECNSDFHAREIARLDPPRS
jgi:hypothetical protein